jgi:hypothetical protein
LLWKYREKLHRLACGWISSTEGTFNSFCKKYPWRDGWLKSPGEIPRRTEDR